MNECVVNCGLSYDDAMGLPIAKRHYWIEQTRKKKQAQQGQPASKDGRQIIRGK